MRGQLGGTRTDLVFWKMPKSLKFPSWKQLSSYLTEGVDFLKWIWRELLRAGDITLLKRQSQRKCPQECSSSLSIYIKHYFCIAPKYHSSLCVIPVSSGVTYTTDWYHQHTRTSSLIWIYQEDPYHPLGKQCRVSA